MVHQTYTNDRTLSYHAEFMESPWYIDLTIALRDGSAGRGLHVITILSPENSYHYVNLALSAFPVTLCVTPRINNPRCQTATTVVKI